MPPHIVEQLMKDVANLSMTVAKFKIRLDNLHGWIRWSLGVNVATFLAVVGLLGALVHYAK